MIRYDPLMDPPPFDDPLNRKPGWDRRAFWRLMAICFVVGGALWAIIWAASWGMIQLLKAIT